MKLGLNLGYLTRQRRGDALLPLVQEAERLGYAVAWVAEAYGSDAPTVLAWLAGQTSRIELGSAVMQIPARTPAATAMTAATLDTLSGGRFRLGLGVSGPQVSEGWHGVRFADPLGRTREYVAIVRAALARERLAYAGRHFTLPLPDGPGKALKLALPAEPPDATSRPQIPLYLAAIGPGNLRLAGEVADGWLAVFFAPEHAGPQLAAVRAGRAAAGRTDLGGFDVVASVPVVPGDDVATCADAVRGYAALYLGGMGSREQNFYHRLAVTMGFGAAADTVQDLFLAGRYREAAAAVPWEFLDQTSLLGPVDRIADRLRAFADAGVTTLSVLPQEEGRAGEAAQRQREALRTIAAAAEAAGVAE